MRYKHIIFDLDGTLIDSSKGIVEAIKNSFKKNNIAMCLTPEASLIGPPLMETLSVIANSKDEELLNILAKDFKNQYDKEGFKILSVFDGVLELLKKLSTHDTELIIATNKREFPTLKIIQYLNWQQYFSCIYALDSFQPAKKDKGNLLKQIISQHQLDKKQCCYIGDRLSDAVAAKENQVDFFFAKWGYAEKENIEEISGEALSSPKELLDHLV